MEGEISGRRRTLSYLGGLEVEVKEYQALPAGQRWDLYTDTKKSSLSDSLLQCQNGS